MSEEENTEKEHEPSQKRLEDARAKGDLARSADLNTAAAYGGLLPAAMMLGASNLKAFGTLGMDLLSEADRLAPEIVSDHGAMMGTLLWDVTKATAPWLLLPAAAVLLSILAQQSLVFAPEKIQFKLSRINPMATAGQKFGRDGLFEFVKSMVKMAVVSLILGIFLTQHMQAIIGSMNLSPAMATMELMQMVKSFLFTILILAATFGALDYLWQRASLMRRNRMSRQDLIDETKQNEGDPFIKHQRRQRGQEIAMNQMMLDVPKADVVIVNPTHYAVALKWKRNDKGAPVCLAKGTDEVAARIRSVAAAAGIPMHRDAPTARALHATVQIGEEIHPDHYRAVAAAIRFAERMQARARRRA